MPSSRAVGGLKAGRFRLTTGRDTTVLTVPLPVPDGLLADLSGGAPGGGGFMVTTERRLERTLRRAVSTQVLPAALAALPAVDPALSARHFPSRLQASAVVAGALGLLAGALDLWPGAALAVGAVAALAFLGVGWLRLLASVEHAPAPAPPPLADDGLPTYTVMAALYREEALAAPLIARLAALDYPEDRREVMIVVEADDGPTLRAAERAAQGRRRFRVVVVPPGRPRTKPRALTYALAFARGGLVAVYDAEDRPEPDQLRKAAAALANGPAHLACVQARLVVDRTVVALQRQFAIEYACLFDGLLPWLAANRLPLPLGGTSNHFKKIALDSVGGWDPWNVTEDADLAVRLARFGLTTDTIDSATFEEAPARLKVWFRQRVRWIKGWMTCYLVAMRQPLKLWRETGFSGFLAIQVLFGATPLAMLAHPIGLAIGILHVAGLRPLPLADGFGGDLVVAVLLIGAATGYGANVYLARRVLKGRKRRDLLTGTWAMPLYWLLISAAAWWALVDLLRRPHHWAKTPHVEHEANEKRPRETGLQWFSAINKLLKSWSG